MLLAKKIRLYPNKQQESLFRQFVGAARFAWNESLRFRIDRYENGGQNTTIQQGIEHLQDLKYNYEDYEWLQTIPEAITKQSVKDLDKAYKGFFKGTSGYPKFKKKGKSNDSFYQRTDNFRQVDDTHIKITGIKAPVRIRKYQIPKKVKNPRVSFDGKYWYISFSYDVDEQSVSISTKVIGIDLGIKDLVITSDGVKYGNINKTQEVKGIEKHKKKLQRQLSRKYEMNKQGSKFVKTSNIRKLEYKIRLLDRRLKNIRNTYIHEVTKDLVRTKPKAIVIEDLNVNGMMKNRHLSKVIQQAEFYKIRQYLTYKGEYYGVEVRVADRMFPSSKTCSCCGNVKKQLSLSERIYKCEVCSAEIDRDINAAINLSKCIKTKKIA